MTEILSNVLINSNQTLLSRLLIPLSLRVRCGHPPPFPATRAKVAETATRAKVAETATRARAKKLPQMGHSLGYFAMSNTRCVGIPLEPSLGYFALSNTRCVGIPLEPHLPRVVWGP